MRILLASDKFKGSLSAEDVAKSLQSGLLGVLPQANFDFCPIADGGEGTTAAVVKSTQGEWKSAEVTDAQGRPKAIRYGFIKATHQAVMEMSAASGLDGVRDLKLNPQSASTRGTGEMMLRAKGQGAQSILIGIGGSATNDGGLGLALALGYRFESQGKPFFPTLETLLEVDRLLPPATTWMTEVLVACDVENPLLGPTGATRIYGPQKGVTDFIWFEERLTHLANLVQKNLGKDLRNIPGAGAAGGLGFGLMAFANGKLTSGFDLVANQIGLAERIRQADLVITGEGRLDGQSLQGKGPVGVAKLARQLGKKVVGVAGSIENSVELHSQFDLLIGIKPDDMPLEEAMRRTSELISQAIQDHRAALTRLINA
jgi:glycerate kinase